MDSGFGIELLLRLISDDLLPLIQAFVRQLTRGTCLHWLAVMRFREYRATSIQVRHPAKNHGAGKRIRLPVLSSVCLIAPRVSIRPALPFTTHACEIGTGWRDPGQVYPSGRLVDPVRNDLTPLRKQVFS